jgi:hypothetical protein
MKNDEMDGHAEHKESVKNTNKIWVYKPEWKDNTGNVGWDGILK